jgi:hypothetical protein
MLDRSGIGSEVVASNSIPDDPYQPIEGGEDTRSAAFKAPEWIQLLSFSSRCSESLPGTPIQSAPDYVLNPLSIFRMARKSIPERHAPEKATTSSGPNSARPEHNADVNTSPIDQMDKIHTVNAISNEHETNQASLEELQTLFMSDLGWAWQPADTAVGSGIETAGLLPWAGGYSTTQAEPWLPVFPFPQQS